MKLYMVPLAPNPTKVMLYLAERAEAGVDLGVEQVVVNTLKGRHKEGEHIARNPFGTLPVLELDDGRYLRESLAIIDYLEARFPEGALARDGAEDRALDRDLERTVEFRLAIPFSRYVHAVNSPLRRPPQPEIAAEIEAALPPALDHLEGLLADGRPLLAGAHVSSADFTLQAACQFLRFAELDLFGDRPGLRAWDEGYRARPAARAVLKW